MELVGNIIVFLAGVGLVFATVASAIRTVVLPRAVIARLTRAVFFTLRRLLVWLSRRAGEYHKQDSVLALHGPLGLLALPIAWALGVFSGFALMLWASGVADIGTALVVSGSSFTTLGFHRPDTGLQLALSIIESLIGLGVVAILIAYLPSIYGSFSRREIIVADFALKSGGTLHGPRLIEELAALGCLDRLDEMWSEWERWFIELSEGHTSEPSLNFFRSPRHDRSWLTTAAAILDAAIFRNAVLAMPMSTNARTTYQAGVQMLQDIGSFFSIAIDPDIGTTTSVSRNEFDDAVDSVAAQGAPVTEDRDAAWQRFVVQRSVYEIQLLELCGLIMPPPAPWSSDRPKDYRTPPIFRRLPTG